MELTDMLRVVRRWLWLIIAVVAVTELALWLGTRSVGSVYAATVKLQFSTPQREDVAAYDEYRALSVRDEIAVSINNLVELLQSEEVLARTTSQLGLEGEDAIYTVKAERASDADFVEVIVEARTPSLAAEIANAHVAIAIAYYGELRAQSTKADENLFAEQLRLAEKEYRAAENALADFRTENGIYSLESQMTTQQRLLEQLQLERDQRLLDRAATVIAATATPVRASTTNRVAATTATPIIDLVGEVDKLIAQRLKELEQLTALTPQYNLLLQNVEQSRAVYQHLLSKYSEAQLKITAVLAANFIQVVKPAYTPVDPASNWPMLAILTLVGSLGLGVVLAFLLEYLTGSKAASVPVPVSDQKMPSPGHTGRGLWKRPRKTFRQDDLSFESASFASPADNVALQDQQGSTYEPASLVSPADTVAEQEPIAVQDQQVSSYEPASLGSPADTVAEQEPVAVQDQQVSAYEAASLGSSADTGAVQDQQVSAHEAASLGSSADTVAVQDQQVSAYEAASLGSSADAVAEQDQQDSTIKAESESVHVSDQKTPSRGKRSRHKTRSTDWEQESIAVQVQQDSTIKAESESVHVSDQKTPSRGKRSRRKKGSTDVKQESKAAQDQNGSTESEGA